MDSWKNADSKKESIRSRLSGISPRKWIVWLLLGLLLAVAALPVSHKKQKDEGILFSETETADVQKTELEEKLEALLENVEGVRKVQVMIMTDEKKDSQGFYDSGGVKVTGVLISAEGGDNSVVVRDIQQAVMALFQVEAHKIKVMKMK